jgi:signal transduction histidine kinase
MSSADACHDEAEGLTRRVQVLLDAAVELTSEHDLDAVLAGIVAGAASVTGARYAALAVYDEEGALARFVYRGMDDATVARIGALPRGVGLLGAAAVAKGPVRIDDVGADPRFTGFPARHPPMGAFLGVPVGRGGRHLGNLYLTDPIDRVRFDATDEALVMTLAAFAAGAVESSELLAAERARADAVARSERAEVAAAEGQEMLVAVIAAQEAERARVARDLHDDIGQALTSVLLGLRQLNDPSIVALRDIVVDAIRRTRQLAFDLHPTVLDDVGLAAAISRLAAEVSARTGVAVDAVVDGVPPREELSAEIATVAYRVVQESLTNVIRHARARTVSVTVTVHGGRLRAVVEDDGVGFDPSRSSEDLGLRGMRERAGLVHGTLSIASAPGRGTSVALEVPVDGS